MVPTDRLRDDGQPTFAAAARLGAKRFITQSIILGYGYRDHGDQVLDERTPFGQPAGGPTDPHLAAMRAAEEQAFSSRRRRAALRLPLRRRRDREAALLP